MSRLVGYGLLFGAVEWVVAGWFTGDPMFGLAALGATLVAVFVTGAAMLWGGDASVSVETSKEEA